MKFLNKTLHKLIPLFCGACMAGTFLLLVGIIGYIFYRGLPAMSWNFFISPTEQSGIAGGIFYQIIGTLVLGIATAIIVSPLAYGYALIHSFFLRNGKRKRLMSVFIYSLNGFPSIIFGLFGFFLFVKFFGWGKSWLAGGILLAFVSLPTITVAIIDRIKEISSLHKEAAYAMGFDSEKVAWSVVIPQSLGGYFTGLFLGLARAVGETAPILFTATVFSGATLPSGITQSPVLSLPYHLFVLAQDSYNPQALTNGWGGALTLIGIVFTLSLLALPARMIIHQKANRDE